jgi:hypothetical protein
VCRQQGTMDMHQAFRVPMQVGLSSDPGPVWHTLFCTVLGSQGVCQQGDLGLASGIS